MRFIAAPNALTLLAVPSAGFVLGPAQQQRIRSRVALLDSTISDLDTRGDFEPKVIVTSTEPEPALITTIRTSAGEYDPSDAYADDNCCAELEINLLEEELLSPDSLLFQQSSCICRDLDGNPLSHEYFAQKMGIDHVERYICPEKDAFHGLMSNGGRVHLFPGGETAFYKRIAFEDLEHAQEKLRDAPHKLVRDAKSYHVVGSFLLSKGCKSMVEATGVCIPKCFDAQLEPNGANPMESKFSFLLEDLSPAKGWYQQWLLCDVEDCKAALSSFAKIHAFFWNGSAFWDDANAAKEFEESVWKSGSYVQPEAQNWHQCKIVAEEWGKKKLRFEEELSSFEWWDDLGERLESVAVECGRLAHPFADEQLSKRYQKHRTFCHGDPKAANLLFRQTPSELQVGLVDFQWSGFGLSATDIAHFMTSAVHADLLVDGGEDTLLRHYYDELQTYLVEYGAYDTEGDVNRTYSYDTFLDQYEIGVLDICRLMIAYTWNRFSEPAEKGDEEACARTFNKTSYNKSVCTFIWLLSRCDEILKTRGF